MDESTLMPVSVRSGSVQGRTLELTRYANAIAGAGGTIRTADGTFQDGTRFNGPYGITTDGRYLYITDYQNHTIRRMELATGQVITLAGVAGEAGLVTGTQGEDARFDRPRGITYHDGVLYVADGQRDSGPGTRVRTVDPETGATAALIGTDSPIIEAIDMIVLDGYLYVTDFFGNSVHRYNLSNGGLEVFAGERLYVSDQGDNRIREILLDESREFESIQDVAGNEGTAGTNWGTGPVATFGQPIGITTDGVNLYVADRQYHLIRKIQ